MTSSFVKYTAVNVGDVPQPLRKCIGYVFIVLLIGMTMSATSCSTVEQFANAARPVATRLLNTAELATAIAEFEHAYVDARVGIVRHRARFTEEQWGVLERGNSAFVNLNAQIDQLRLSEKSIANTATIAVTSSELVRLIVPVRDAGRDMIRVLDNQLMRLSADEAQRYLRASRYFSLIDGKLQSAMTSSEGRSIDTGLLIEVVRVAAQVIGIVAISIQGTQ